MKADSLHIGDETLQAPIFPNQSATSVQKSSSDTKITKSRTLKVTKNYFFTYIPIEYVKMIIYTVRFPLL